MLKQLHFEMGIPVGDWYARNVFCKEKYTNQYSFQKFSSSDYVTKIYGYRYTEIHSGAD